jgi:hypothetical protein
MGEFASALITINRFTGSILLMKRSAQLPHGFEGYPRPVFERRIHWDMIGDLRQDSEIRLDGELPDKNGVRSPCTPFNCGQAS